MTGKQSQSDDNEDNQSRIKLIADKRRLLEEKSAQVRFSILPSVQESAGFILHSDLECFFRSIAQPICFSSSVHYFSRRKTIDGAI